MERWLKVCVIAAAISVAIGRPAGAQTADNLLLIVNDRSPESIEIGEYYARKRAVPAANILHLSASAADEVSRADFDRDINTPIGAWFGRTGAHDRILYLVLTKGVPLRIAGTSGLDGTMASVDSELTLLYRRMAGARVPILGRLSNPYFAGETQPTSLKPFNHEFYDIFLVTRLDGFSVQDVMGLIDRGVTPAGEGKIVLDQKATLIDRGGDAWLQNAGKRLSSMGLQDRVVLDTGSRVVTGTHDVLGYYSWGSNDPAIKQRHFDFTFAPGALAGMFVSSDGRTFAQPPSDWNVGTWENRKTHFAGSPQSLAGDLIHDGVTGIAAHVAEPYLDATIRPDVLFPAYVAGLNLAESFYLGMRFLSWQTVVVGDPLCAPFKTSPLTSAQIDAGIDPATELPRYFAARRLQNASRPGWKPEATALYLRGESRIAKGDKAGARQAFEEAVTLDGQMDLAHRALGMLHDESGEYDKAIDRYRAALSAAPNDAITLNNLAYDLGVRKNQPLEALPLAERAYKSVTNSPVIGDTLGWIQHLLGNDAEAGRLFVEVGKQEGGSATVHLHAAIVFDATDRRTDAIRELDRALALAPDLAQDDDVVRLTAKLKQAR